jgi:alkaline phosphatase D
MAVIARGAASLTRRHFLTTMASSAAITATGSIARPYASRAADRPLITHGIQSGDVSIGCTTVWARADRPSRMRVEVATTDSFSNIRSVVFADALPETDFTTKALIEDLPPGQDVFYRIRFEDLSFPVLSEPQVGHFRTAPSERRNVSFVWSGDTAGGGWGIDESRGGMRTYATMLRSTPDFFIHCGDHIYADCPIASERKLPNGQVWRNIVTEEKSRTARTLAEFRGNYKYNLLDKNVRAFNAQVPILAQWDDHEVSNDWCPDAARGRAVRGGNNLIALAARGRRAFHEFMPLRTHAIYRKISYGPLLDIFLLDMRSYRTALREDGSATPILGRAQASWLKRELMHSRATWKVIAADLPIGVVSGDAVGQGNGPPRGREIEIADLLAFSKHAGIRNIVWLTADMHHTAAHYYDPKRGRVPRLRAVLGIHLRPDPCRDLAPATARQHFRSARGVPEGLQRRSTGRSRSLFRAAILRPGHDRRRQRGDDGHPQGRRGPGPLVYPHRAADGAMVARCPSHAQLGRTT